MFLRGFATAFLAKLAAKAADKDPTPEGRLHVLEQAPVQAPPVALIPADANGMLNLGQIAARLGYRLPAEFLSSMGIEPASIQMSARLYREVDFLRLLDGLDAHHAQLRGAYLTSPLSPGEHGRAQ